MIKGTLHLGTCASAVCYYSWYGSGITTTESQSHYSSLTRSLWSCSSADSVKICSESFKMVFNYTWLVRHVCLSIQTHRHLVTCKSETIPHCTPRGQINSSTSVVSSKQIPRLIYSFAAWHSHVQGYSWNLPSPSNPFSIFLFLLLLLLSIFSLSLALSRALSHFSLSLSSPPSLLSSFVHAAWVSQMEWLQAMQLCKTQFK